MKSNAAKAAPPTASPIALTLRTTSSSSCMETIHFLAAAILEERLPAIRDAISRQRILYPPRSMLLLSGPQSGHCTCLRAIPYFRVARRRDNADIAPVQRHTMQGAFARLVVPVAGS